jgi:Zn-dependent protease with chaperone function
VWLTVANVLASGTLTLLPLLSGTLEDALYRWLRAAELTCDRAALLVAQDPRVVISVLMKLAGGSPSIAAELNVDAFLRQVSYPLFVIYMPCLVRMMDFSLRHGIQCISSTIQLGVVSVMDVAGRRPPSRQS